MNKINFNKFIWFYWKMKKKLFFGGFPVAGMSKKKKKTELQVAGWATAQFFLSLSHNTTSYIVTGKAGRQRRGALGHAFGWPRYGQAMSTTRRGRAIIRSGESATRSALHAVGS